MVERNRVKRCDRTTVRSSSQTAALAGRGRCARQYSSPSRATRNSRLGSVNSVAPQVAHLWSGSVFAARLNFETLAPRGHFLALPEIGESLPDQKR